LRFQIIKTKAPKTTTPAETATETITAEAEDLFYVQKSFTVAMVRDYTSSNYI